MIAPKIDPDQARDAADRLIVALDVDSRDKAIDIVSELDGLISAFKIGLQLFTVAGPEFVERLVSQGKKIFLDLKFHDIPNTVAKAGVEAARLGVWMFNVHASGGTEMMRRTFSEVSEFSVVSNRPRPLIIGVTVLTSSDVSTLREMGMEGNLETQVTRLAGLAESAGLDGVVASANEIRPIRQAVAEPRFLIVTPGIRPFNATKDDQKRVMSPGAAISEGADHLVVGRPIINAADRADAAGRILEEIREIR